MSREKPLTPLVANVLRFHSVLSPKQLTWAGGGLLADPLHIPIPSRRSPAMFWPWDSKQLTPCLMTPGSTSFTGTLRRKVTMSGCFSLPSCLPTPSSRGQPQYLRSLRLAVLGDGGEWGTGNRVVRGRNSLSPRRFLWET